MKNTHKLKLYNQISLSDYSKSIILGSILGDGCLKIYKGYKNARLSIRHSIIQQDYLMWQINQLTEISGALSEALTNPKSLQIQSASGYSKHNKLLYQSKALPELTQLYDLTYKNNKLKIKRSWLNNMTSLSLAIWWLDDGSLIGRKKKGVICTDGFDIKSVNILSNYLYKVWGIENRVACIKRLNQRYPQGYKEYPRIWIGTIAMRKLIEIIKEHVPESMKYKIEMK